MKILVKYLEKVAKCRNATHKIALKSMPPIYHILIVFQICLAITTACNKIDRKTELLPAVNGNLKIIMYNGISRQAKVSLYLETPAETFKLKKLKLDKARAETLYYQMAINGEYKLIVCNGGDIQYSFQYDFTKNNPVTILIALDDQGKKTGDCDEEILISMHPGDYKLKLL